MKNKIKLIYRVGKRAIKKVGKGQLRYKDKGIFTLSYLATRYAVKNGAKATLVKFKQNIVEVDRKRGASLYFPNGLVSGVNPETMLEWYGEHAKPVTVVIPSYNDLNVLIPCLESIAKTSNPELVKVIVVDDYCQEENRKELRKLENDQVRVLYREENGGFSKAVNTGLLAAAQDQDVVLVNSDIIAHAGWIEGLQYGAYEFGVDTGIVGPKLLYPDGRIQSGGSYRNTEVPEFFDHYYRFQDSNYGPANVPQYCLGVTGACMYVKREFLDYVGILDEDFPFAFEDADWCLRGWEAGFRTLYFPAAVLTHVESATRAKNKTMSVREKASMEYFWKKWGDWFDKRNVRDEQGRIRVIYVLQTLGWSGGIKMVFDHANRLDKKKFSVEIWGLDHHKCPWHLDKDVKLRTFKNYERLSAALEDQEAIKVATWWETAFPVWLSSIKKGIAVYFIQEIETWFYPNDVVAQSAIISCYRKEFKNMTTSQYNLEEIQAMGLRATAIPCGFDKNINKPLPNVKREDNMLASNGRKFFQKNFEFTLKGWQAMGESRPNLLLYGSEPELARRDKKITYVTAPSNEEVNEIFNKATVFIQTSRHEGFCLPLLEAMATSAPVVCTDAHGNRDFCFDGKNCLIVEHDDVEGLKKALEKLFNDPALRKRLGDEAKKTADEFEWGKVMKKVSKFYEQVAKQ
jgi:GT2 family glycosyltransferase